MDGGADATIRPYRPDDAAELMDIWSKANALAHPFLPEPFIADLAREVREIHLPAAETHVCVVAGRIVGFIALIGDEIGGLFADPEVIGQGYGRALVDHAVALKGPLRVEVFRDNGIGRAFYDRYGFLPQDEYLHRPSGAVMCRMAMPRNGG